MLSSNGLKSSSKSSFDFICFVATAFSSALSCLYALSTESSSKSIFARVSSSAFLLTYNPFSTVLSDIPSISAMASDFFPSAF